MLEGFSTVLAAFFVFCLYRQDLIRKRSYYYATFACLLGIILFNVFYYFMENTYGRGFCAIMLGLLHAGALVLTMAYVGGLSIRQIGFEVKEAAEDFRPASANRPTGQSPVDLPQSPKPVADAPPPAASRDEPHTPRDQPHSPRIVIALPKKSEE